jgi:uncharacterized protein YbjT (DUF2867 family)
VEPSGRKRPSLLGMTEKSEPTSSTARQIKVAVAGGTGRIGRYVVASLRRNGAEPVVLARSQGIDVVSGAGLASALRGVDAVIDVTDVASNRRSVQMAFFEQATKNLLDEGARAGVRNHVVLSILGCDRAPAGYYQAKQRQEELVLASGRPGTVLRATQFHEFAAQIVDRARVGPLSLVPRMRTQPIAAREVAEALATLALGPAVGMAPEIAGPQEEDLLDMVRRFLRRQRLRRILLPVRLPGPAGRAIADGALLPRAPGRRGVQTFADWLATPHDRTLERLNRAG